MICPSTARAAHSWGIVAVSTYAATSIIQANSFQPSRIFCRKRSSVAKARHTYPTLLNCGVAIATISIVPTSAVSTEATNQVRNTVSRKMASATSESSIFDVAQFLCLSDNYGYLIHDNGTGETAAIDTPCGKTYKAELDKRGWSLTHIFNTHHHWDHTGGNMDLKNAYKNVKVFGPASERDKIPGIDVAIAEGDCVQFGSSHADVLEVGGHTKGHIAYHFPKERSAFVGDSLFALGCGKMFEGTPTQFWKSLSTLRSLPDETTIYCAHEYTESNAKFAVSVEPGNADLQSRFEQIKKLRSQGQPTVPSLLGEEKRTNPFLRVDVSKEIRKNVGAEIGESPAEVFAKVRHAKDSFRG